MAGGVDGGGWSKGEGGGGDRCCGGVSASAGRGVRDAQPSRPAFRRVGFDRSLHQWPSRGCSTDPIGLPANT
jgi:hypothetical protein